MTSQDSSEPSITRDAAPWVEAHLDVLMGYALLRVRDREAAEDLVQETLLAAWRGRDTFRGQSSERTGLIGIRKRRSVDD